MINMFDFASTIKSIEAQIDKNAGGRIYIGFSGGLDSSVLLHVLASSSLKSHCTAVHIHHGLSVYADDWLLHCMRVCGDLDVPLVSKQVMLDAEKGDLENQARQARYQVFDARLSKEDLLLTAHHQNDQAETFLYRAFRGAGLKGLGGMAGTRQLSQSKLFRPFLNVSRRSLEEYAQSYGLTWINDDSNTDTRFDRNYIRQDIIPVIENKWPKVVKGLASTAEKLQGTQQLLNQYLDKDLDALELQGHKVGQSICLDKFSVMDTELQQALIRRWCDRLGFYAPEEKQLVLIADLINAKADASPILRWGDVQLRRYQKRIYLLPVLPDLNHEMIRWDGCGEISLPGGFCLSSCGELKNTQFIIQFEKAGLRCKPVGRSRSQTLKKLMQEYGIEPWLRPFVPLVYFDDELVAVGDYWVCKSEAVACGVEFVWQHKG